MENVGKKLREKNQAKFEDNDSSSASAVSSVPSLEVSGFDELTTETQKQRASRGFSQDAMFESPFANDHFNSKLLGIDLGPVMESQYENKGFNSPLNPHIDFEAMKAANQSAFSKMGSLTAQFIGKTAIGTVGNIVGAIYGLGEWAGGAMGMGDGDINSVWDNSIYRSLDEATEAVEAKNSLFVNNKDGLGLNFKTFKEINDAFSFISQAALSELIMQTAGNLVGGAGLATLPLRLTRYGKQIGKLTKMLDKAEDVEKLALKLGASVEDMSRLKRISDVSKAVTNNARRAITTTGYEASLEARGTKDQMISDMTEELDYELEKMDMTAEDKKAYRAAKLTEIEQAANSAGLMTFGLNTAVLSISNAMQFPQIFGNNFTKNIYTGGLVRKGIGQIGKKEGKKAAAKRAFGTMGRILKNPATEFMEETIQGVSSNYSQNYFELNLGKRTQAGVLSPYVNNVAESVYGAVTETYGTQEGLHEGIIGGIVGAIGLPGLKKHKKGRKLTLHGGIAESVRQEKDRRKQIDDAITSINNMPMSDVAKYNKDNAILSALDPQKEDFAIMQGNKVEFESVQDNKVFRYTQDRLEKGMEEFIDEDIDEMRTMVQKNFENYKKTFGKDESFTEQEAIEEINKFEKKVGIYKDAYKAVHKRFNLNLMRGDDVTKTLTDTLTHAIATEQVYGARLDKVKEDLFKRLNGKFTKEQVEMFVNTSGKVAAVQDVIDDYIATRNAEKAAEPLNAKENNKKFDKQQKMKEDLGASAHLLDLSKEQLQAEIDLLNDKAITSENENKEKTQEQKEYETTLKKAFKLKDSYDALSVKKFHANKSSKVRNMNKDLDELTAAINEEVEKRTSAAMKDIKKPPKKVTRAEIQEYLNQKSEIIKELNNEFNSDAVFQLAKEDYDSAEDLIQEMHEITDKYTTATSVAGYLYGFKKNPSEAYAKILTARFRADFDNADRLSQYLDALMDNKPDPEFIAMFEEFKDIIESMQEELDEIYDAFGKEGAREITREFRRLKNKIKKYNTFLNLTKELDEQDESAIKEAKKQAAKEELSDEAPDFGDVVEDTEGTSDDTGTDDPAAGDTKKKKKAAGLRNNNNNRLSMRENSSFVGKHHPDFKTKLEDGTIKNKAAVTLNLVEESVDPENDPELKAYLQEEGVLDSYVAGMKLINNDAKVLNAKDPKKMDPDVYTFIRYAPIKLNIYDKVLTPEDKYEFEITENDKPVFTQDRFFKADDLLTIDQDAALKEKEFHDKDEALIEEEEAKLEQLKKDKNDTRTRIIAEYKKKREDLKEEYKSSANNAYSNFNFRYNLIKNAYVNKVNETKLKVHNTDLGNFEVFNFESKIIKEESPATLGFDPATMTLDDIFYGNQNGEFVRIDGENTSKQDHHPMKYMKGDGINGKIFFGYKNVSGKQVPIKMNTSKLDTDHIKKIIKVMHDYYDAPNKEKFRVSNTGIPFVDKLKGTDRLTINQFMEIFLRQKAHGGSKHVIYLKNTFNLFPNKETGQREFFFYTGDATTLIVRSKKDLETLGDKLVKELQQNRFTVNSNILLDKDDNINRDVLEYYFEKGIITHTFDTEKNFNKIYSPENLKGEAYNKGIILSENTTPDSHNTVDKPANYNTLVRELRKTLGGHNKKTDYEVNLRKINSNMLNGILNSIRKQTLALDHNDPTDKEINEIIKKAVENITNSRLQSIQDVINLKPNKWDPQGNHDTDFKIKDTDTEIDKFLRTIYAFKDEAYQSKSFMNQTRAEAKTWGAKSKLLNAFRDATKSRPINKYLDRKSNKIGTQFTSKEQFDNFMEIVYLLERTSALEKEEGATGYMHINYSEDYVKNKDGITTYKYKDQSNLRKDNKTKKHYKTRLTSVEIDGMPRWEKGKVVGGNVFLNVRSWDYKNKKETGDQLILIANEEAKLPKQNIVTSMALPFVKGGMEVDQDTIDEMLESIETRSKARQRNTKKIIIDTQKAIGRNDLDIESLNAVTDEQTAAYTDEDVDEAFEESGAVDPDKVGKKKKKTTSKTPAPVPEPSIDISGYMNEDTLDSIGELIDEGLIFFPNNITPELREQTREQFEAMDINSPDKLLLIINRYKQEKWVDPDLEITKFAEYIFEKEVEDNCSGKAPF